MTAGDRERGPGRDLFGYRPIGIVRSPHAEAHATPVQPSFARGCTGTVEIDPCYEAGLDGIEGFSHIVLVVALHAARVVAPGDDDGLTVVPFGADEPRGVFATRSPSRPNPIGLTVVRLLRREGCTLHVDGLDVLDATPVLDVKPYVPQYDIVPDAREDWVGAVTAAAARRGRRASAGPPADAPRVADQAAAHGGTAHARATGSLHITVLIDDHRGETELEAEHGLALWLETAAGAVLFDTGAGPKAAANARRLGVSLEGLETVVLSHGHYDHSGGLATVLDEARFAQVVAHPGVALPRWSRRPDGQVVAIGMPRGASRALAACAARTTWITDHLEVVPGVHVTGPIPRPRDDEGPAEPFFLDRATTIGDPLPDDQALWVETTEGPVIVVGCAHSGLLATLDRVAELRGDARVRAVVGGMHLLHAGAERLEHTVAELERRRVGSVAPGHCTGTRASALLAERFRRRCLPLHAGRRLQFA
ncbi:MAG TPA: tRNA (N6-threonylcarbamoyladenosine(37)-N6)-methyltransferase TrmO [Thermoleophilia bacterium]|nr:tRNA (N6-threonylcarbamoyladenosine(37)-N6)-methyltransferase TrmO [Thermoleophilia bacterium]